MTDLRFPLLALALAAVPAGCRVTETTRSVPGDRGEVRRATAVHVWNVLLDGNIEGEVVLFRTEGRPADAHYVVRNVWQQDLGLIDSLGRAYRFAPHTPEPVWVGTGTVIQGTARILQVADHCTLEDAGSDFLPLPPPAAPRTPNGE